MHLYASFSHALFNVHICFFIPRQSFICATMRRMNKNADNLKTGSLRLLRSLLRVSLTVYLVILLVVGLFQRRLIYFPDHLTGEQVDESAKAAELERWRDPLGQAIGMKRMSPHQPAIGQVLIVYGNGSWSGGCAHYVDDLQNVAELDVFILEYPGYADRPGSPSQASLFHAADQALQLLPASPPIYLLGESLGSGVAAYLGGTQPDKIAGMILLSPYDRLANVAQHRLPFLPARLMLLDRFPSEDYLHSYHGPIGIMIDGRDFVVPPVFGQRLYDGYTGPKRLWNFSGGSHITIMEPRLQFWREVLDFWITSHNDAKQAMGK
jgi:pimeloyl-ACP methyl ester carboxylesterase